MSKKEILERIYELESENFSVSDFNLDEGKISVLDECYKLLKRDLKQTEIFDIIELRKQKMEELLGEVYEDDLNIALYPNFLTYNN